MILYKGYKVKHNNGHLFEWNAGCDFVCFAHEIYFVLPQCAELHFYLLPQGKYSTFSSTKINHNNV